MLSRLRRAYAEGRWDARDTTVSGCATPASAPAWLWASAIVPKNREQDSTPRPVYLLLRRNEHDFVIEQASDVRPAYCQERP